jgi:hypothetical protein
MSKPSPTDLYRKNSTRISVLQQFSNGCHVFVNDPNANMFPTEEQYYTRAAEDGIDMHQPGFYAILNTFFDLGKDSKNNYTVNAVSRLPDERTAKDLSYKLYKSEISRYENGVPNLLDPMFQKYAQVLFEGASPEILTSDEPASVSTPEPTGPLLNEKNGMVDIGKIVNGQLCSFWVPMPVFVQLAPGVLISRALLEAGSR